MYSFSLTNTTLTQVIGIILSSPKLWWFRWRWRSKQAGETSVETSWSVLKIEMSSSKGRSNLVGSTKGQDKSASFKSRDNLVYAKGQDKSSYVKRLRIVSLSQRSRQVDLSQDWDKSARAKGWDKLAWAEGQDKSFRA